MMVNHLRGGLLPRPLPDGLPVVLGALTGFDMMISFVKVDLEI